MNLDGNDDDDDNDVEDDDDIVDDDGDDNQNNDNTLSLFCGNSYVYMCIFLKTGICMYASSCIYVCISYHFNKVKLSTTCDITKLYLTRWSQITKIPEETIPEMITIISYKIITLCFSVFLYIVLLFLAIYETELWWCIFTCLPLESGSFIRVMANVEECLWLEFICTP